VLKLLESFVIARFQDGHTFLIELKDGDTGLHVQLGDRDNWNYALDADSLFSSFCLQF
jgi:hypothetical protein